MMGDSWNGKTKGDGISKVIKRVKPDVPLAKKVEAAQRHLAAPISRLRAIDEKLQTKDAQLFKRVVSAQRARNNAYATMYANELVQVRKMKDMVAAARLSMEQMQLRLNTLSELGDVVVTLSPCMALINDLGPAIGSIMPEATESMQDLSTLMGDLISSSSVDTDTAINAAPQSQDSMDILRSVDTKLSEEAQKLIPTVPDGMGAAATVPPDIPESIKNQKNKPGSKIPPLIPSAVPRTKKRVPLRDIPI